jgi:hypothetical protein
MNKNENENENTVLSEICIPRMERTIRREFIFNILRKLNIGYIERINEIPLKNEVTHKRVIIRIKWNSTETSKMIQQRFESNQHVNIVYELPWFWKLVLCK